uniref:F-box domain-containing protein n=1 Tax=Erpetoichthys calabaricus TaxID=27687 RepID=A0A8C4T7P0_ERPCA
MGASRRLFTERNVKDVKLVMDLSEVSDDILFLILIHVPFCELITNCRLVCKRWKDVVDSQALWRMKYEQALSKKLQMRLPSNTDWKNLKCLHYSQCGVTCTVNKIENSRDFIRASTKIQNHYQGSENVTVLAFCTVFVPPSESCYCTHI